MDTVLDDTKKLSTVLLRNSARKMALQLYKKISLLFQDAY